MIEEKIEPFDEKIMIYSDPNEQYSGGKSNTAYHNLVKKIFMKINSIFFIHHIFFSNLFFFFQFLMF